MNSRTPTITDNASDLSPHYTYTSVEDFEKSNTYDNKCLEVTFVKCTKLHHLSFRIISDVVNISECSNLKSIDVFNNVKNLRINSSDVKKINYGSRNLKHLSIYGCDELKSMSELPDDLISLQIDGCPNLKYDLVLPKSLEFIHIHGSNLFADHMKFHPDTQLKRVFSDADHVTKIVKYASDDADFINYYDEKSYSLSVPYMKAFMETHIKKKTTSLVVNKISDFQIIYDRFIDELIIEPNEEIYYLPELPEKLKKLVINGCPNLVYLPSLPNHLVTLHINKCPGLTSIPCFPPTLKEIRVNF